MPTNEKTWARNLGPARKVRAANIIARPLHAAKVLLEQYGYTVVPPAVTHPDLVDASIEI